MTNWLKRIFFPPPDPSLAAFEVAVGHAFAETGNRIDIEDELAQAIRDRDQAQSGWLTCRVCGARGEVHTCDYCHAARCRERDEALSHGEKAAAVAEQAIRERDEAQKVWEQSEAAHNKALQQRDEALEALLEKTHEWGELLGRLSAEETMHAKTHRDLDEAQAELERMKGNAWPAMCASIAKDRDETKRERDEAREGLREICYLYDADFEFYAKRWPWLINTPCGHPPRSARCEMCLPWEEKR